MTKLCEVCGHPLEGVVCEGPLGDCHPGCVDGREGVSMSARPSVTLLDHYLVWKRGMNDAPHDGSTFLVDTGGARAKPIFRYLMRSNANGECHDGGAWIIVEGCPEEGGHGVAHMWHPDNHINEMARWRWALMPVFK